jgi:hypothetical protein
MMIPVCCNSHFHYCCCCCCSQLLPCYDDDDDLSHVSRYLLEQMPNFIFWWIVTPCGNPAWLGNGPIFSRFPLNSKHGWVTHRTKSRRRRRPSPPGQNSKRLQQVAINLQPSGRKANVAMFAKCSTWCRAFVVLEECHPLYPGSVESEC